MLVNWCAFRTLTVFLATEYKRKVKVLNRAHDVVLSGKMSVNESRGISVKGMFNQKSIVLQTLISMFVV